MKTRTMVAALLATAMSAFLMGACADPAASIQGGLERSCRSADNCEPLPGKTGPSETILPEPYGRTTLYK